MALSQKQILDNFNESISRIGILEDDMKVVKHRLEVIHNKNTEYRKELNRLRTQKRLE